MKNRQREEEQIKTDEMHEGKHLICEGLGAEMIKQLEEEIFNETKRKNREQSDFRCSKE